VPHVGAKRVVTHLERRGMRPRPTTLRPGVANGKPAAAAAPRCLRWTAVAWIAPIIDLMHTSSMLDK